MWLGPLFWHEKWQWVSVALMNLENVVYIVKDITSKSLCKFDFQTVIEGTLATTLLFDGLYKLGLVLCGPHPLGPDQESIFNIPKPVI